MATLSALISEDVRFLEDVDALSVTALQHRRYEKDFFLNIGNLEKQDGYIKKFKKVSAKTSEQMKTMAAYMENDARLNQEVKKSLVNASQAYEKYVSGFLGLVATVQADQTITPQKANKLMKPFKSNIYDFEAGVKNLAKAGKGFAVVANEIKELAKQTAEATPDIRLKIEGIQGSTESTVTEINQIESAITDINEIVATISTAVEEQSSSTKEIASNVNQAAQGIQDVNQNVAQCSTVSAGIAKDVGEVNQAADEMANGSSQVNTSAGELSELSENLKQMVVQFKI